MKRIVALLSCVIIVLMLAGCKGSGGGVSGFLGSTFAGGGSGGDSGGGSPIGHSPEPATVALLGGGFAAYAFLKRKKK